MQLNLFQEQRATSEQAIEITVNSIEAYAGKYNHWQISFSGGKDSTCLVTLMQILKQVEEKGFNSQVVMAELDKRFMVYMLGRGVTPPSNKMRWCTQKIKLDPMKVAMRSLYEFARRFDNRLQQVGEKKKNGDYSSFPNRRGPLTLDARKELLDKILAVQDEVNAASGDRLKIDLINETERLRIEELINNKTFPNGWSGNELRGDVITTQYDSQGNVQRSLW